MVVSILLYRKYATETGICGQFASKTADRVESSQPYPESFINAFADGVPKPRFQRLEIEVSSAAAASEMMVSLRR